MKINTKVLLILLLISLSHITSFSSSFRASFGLMKKSANRNSMSSSSSNASHKSKNTSSSKGISTKYFAVSTAITKSKTVTTKGPDGTESQTTKGGDIPNFSIYFEGWVKYLRYTEMKIKKPKAFFKNTRFAPESRVKHEGHEHDKNGVSNVIPSQLTFFITVYKDNVQFFDSRIDGGASNSIDSLSIADIEVIPDTAIRTGGIKDYGKFDEGYCFRVNTKVPSEFFKQTQENLEPAKFKPWTWIICVDSQQEKDTLMLMLIRLKLKNQHEKNIYLEYEKSAVAKANAKAKIPDGKVGSVFEGGDKKNDCSLVVLHAWTPCTLACGGGKSYLQLMKIPERDGGKPCKSDDLIRTRECNMQPCPSVANMKALTEGNKASTAVMKNATVKMMAISARPQRYDKCHLKESDALMEKDDAETKSFAIKPMIPVRIVMTDKTFTAYLDDTLKSKISTYNLAQAVMIKKPDGRCFVVQNNIKNDKFCMLDSAKGDFVEEWYYDYNLFRNQCKKERAKSSLILTEEKKLEDDYRNKMEGVKADMVNEKANMIKKRVEEGEKRKLVNKVSKVRKISMTAIEKEQRLEDLLEKEEESREGNETDSLQAQIRNEKKKEECLMKAIKEKEIENQYNIAKAQAEHAIQEITKETQKQITKQRENIAKKIIEMRNKQKRKKAQLKSEIMTIRTQIAARLQNINKAGSSKKCTTGLKDNGEREKYCAQNFADNYIKYNDCQQKDSFCYVCCENGFGDIHAVERDNCYTACDNEKK